MKPMPLPRTSKPNMRFASLFFAAVCAFAAPSMQVLPQPPVRFEQRPNQKGPAQWSAQGLGYSLAFTADATLFQLGDKTLSMRLVGSNPQATFEAAAPYSVPTQYFTPAYRGSVQAYQRLRRHQVYPGVDVVFYGTGRSLEYDFEIAADADPSRIRLRFGGADRLRVDLNGDMQVELAGQTITQRLPAVYQTTAAGHRQPVHAEYRLEANHDVSISLDRYNRSAPLVIDPVISLAAYLNGSSSDTGIAITHDAQGFVYMAGNTSSTDFLVTPNGFSVATAAIQNVWVMKLDLTMPANPIVYCSYYGGTGVDSLKGLAVSPGGLIYITGTTISTDLATTTTALQTTNAGTTDGFVAAFDPTQTAAASLLYATYLGGAAVDEPAGIATVNGKIYVTGSTLSDNFPIANSIFPGRQGGREIFVSEIDPTLSGTSSLIFSTYYGGTGTDYGRSIAVDAAGTVYVAGFTYSADLPITTSTAYQPTYAGGGDAFLLQLNTSLPLILYSTYLGGSKTDDARSITVDATGKVALAGYTLSPKFPVTQNAEQPLMGAGKSPTNAFLAILDLTQRPAQALVYSTYFGGSVAEVAQDLATDGKGKYILGGYSYSPDMPVSQNALNAIPGGGGLNGFVAVIDTTVPPLNSLVYASYITGPGSQIVNGVDIDASGTIYLTGYATSDIFPAGGQTHTSPPGNADVYIFILKP
jgi:hypothetical protein